MPRPKYLITTSALLASPSVLAVMVLSAVGALNIWIACLAGMAILIGVLVLLIRPLRRLRGIENQLSSLTDRAPDADIAVHTSDAGGPVGDIMAAIYRLDRIWGHNRKEMHDNLQAAQILFDALPDPLLTLDADARLIYTNAAAQELLVGRHGISDLTGRDLSAVIRQPTILEAVESALSGEPTRTIEFTTADQVD
ncbi:MAG: PAS domain-containing protein, partial [Alphaproteobacteria bacterium]|nr:PAS domain-containing protein [Alphaproteobacteria bacterium]